MKLTVKEKLLLDDLKTQEQVCVTKYEQYASKAKDEQLQTLFNNLANGEKEHLTLINEIISGETPEIPKKKAKKPEPQYTKENLNKADIKEDTYLCNDALAMEKHASALYDTSIFEFCSKDLRNLLNHIQKQEQGHGEAIYNYMSQLSLV